MKYTNVKNIIVIVITLILLYFAYKVNEAKEVLDKAMVNITKLEEKNKIMEDSIKVLNAMNQNYILEISKHESNLDSLTKVKNKVTIKYRDQKKFVHDADIHQLDSVIRSNTTIGF